MRIVPTVVVSEAEKKRIEIALIVVQDLEHLYDGYDRSKMNACGEVVDILLGIINNEQE